MDRLLIVGLGEPEAGALRECLSTPVTCYEMLPRIQLRQGQLYVESPRADGRLLPVARVLFHGIFEDDLPFLGALALWGGPCFPNARGMLDCRLRLPCLVRALRVTRFAGLARGYADCGSAFEADVETRADSASARPPPGECPRAGRRPTGQIRQALPPFRPPLIESPHASPRKCSSRETASVPSVEQRRRGRPSPPGIPFLDRLNCLRLFETGVSDALARLRRRFRHASR
jgi:hypothetical protein